MTSNERAPAPTTTGDGAPLAVFVSDVHLQESMPRTAGAFLSFLRHHAARARQVYLLGDLFEYWAGDDDLDTPFHRSIIAALRALADDGVAVYWVGGNRDFLVGQGFAQAAGLSLLEEPHVTTLADRRIVLLHGDAQCTDDGAYMAFRAQVRQPAWQQQFLSMPLEKRKAIIAELRSGSREAQRGKSYEIMDVNPEAIGKVFADTGAQLMIHGHTHRPAVHDHGDGRIRMVLPDWDADTDDARGGWIALAADGSLTRHGIADVLAG